MKILIILLLLISCIAEDDCIESLSQPTDLIIEINTYRESIALTDVVPDSYVSSIALKHTKYLVEVDSLTHKGIGYRMILLSDYCAESYSEVLAMGYTNEGVLQAWLDSPEHKKTIEGNYNRVGYGIKNKFYTLIFYIK